MMHSRMWMLRSQQSPHRWNWSNCNACSNNHLRGTDITMKYMEMLLCMSWSYLLWWQSLLDSQGVSMAAGAYKTLASKGKGGQNYKQGITSSAILAGFFANFPSTEYIAKVCLLLVARGRAVTFISRSFAIDVMEEYDPKEMLRSFFEVLREHYIGNLVWILQQLYLQALTRPNAYVVGH